MLLYLDIGTYIMLLYLDLGTYYTFILRPGDISYFYTYTWGHIILLYLDTYKMGFIFKFWDEDCVSADIINLQSVRGSN